MDNLAFKGAAAVRRTAGSKQRLAITLDKSIPAAAGLGGGSADAACGLAMAGRYFGVDHATLVQLAPEIGSDVPFCLAGGTARVSGRGEFVHRAEPLSGFSLAIVVPPVEISTPAAFKTWDTLGEPSGPCVDAAALPPPLRGEDSFCNDLYPAAAALVPELDDWRADLERAWGRPVLLSGSGPSLFGFFLDKDEATDAAAEIPIGARFAEACDLSPVGWRIQE
jgi:4-diphosphocytidyl-2-C-methyl-D-erythritol kinase